MRMEYKAQTKTKLKINIETENEFKRTGNYKNNKKSMGESC
jgi:hypothetical protein